MKLNRAELNVLKLAVECYARHLERNHLACTPQAKHLGMADWQLKCHERALDDLANYPLGSKRHTDALAVTS